jgi:hypothetical protein
MMVVLSNDKLVVFDQCVYSLSSWRELNFFPHCSHARDASTLDDSSDFSPFVFIITHYYLSLSFLCSTIYLTATTKVARQQSLNTNGITDVATNQIRLGLSPWF